MSVRASLAILGVALLGCTHETAPSAPLVKVASAARDPDGPPPGATSNARERDIDAGDVRLHVRIAGDDVAPATLLVVNGGPGFSYEYITGLDALAGRERRVAYVDERGVAPSTKPASGDYRLNAHVADFEAVRAALGADRVDLLGHSWGTLVGEAYAVAHPEHLRSLILVNPLAVTSDVQKRAFEKLGAHEDSLVPLGLVPATPPEPVGDDSTARDKARDPRYFADPRHPSVGLHGTRGFVEVRKKSYEAIEGVDFTSMVARVQGPVLVITGDGDPFGQEPFAQTVRSLTSAHVVTATMMHCGHDPMLETYDALIARLRAWLASPG